MVERCESKRRQLESASSVFLEVRLNGIREKLKWLREEIGNAVEEARRSDLKLWKGYLSAGIGVRPWGVAERPLAYDGQAREEVRHYFTWILSLTKEKGNGRTLSFRLVACLQGRVGQPNS